MLWFSFAPIYFGLVVARIIDNIDSIQKQIQSRQTPQGSIIDGLLPQFSTEQTDYLTSKLSELKNFNGTSCEKCHHKVKFAKSIVERDPEYEHLVALILYEYCLSENNNKDTNCNFVDFFIFTNTQNTDANSFAEDSFESTTSINLFSNDFIQMIRHMNVSSKLTLDSYCYYKGKYCKAPPTPELSSIIDLDSMWPEKQQIHNSEPEYKNQNRDLFNVLHISDFHDELRYQVGSEANCSQGLCCLPESFNKELTGSKYNFTNVYKDAGANRSIALNFYPGSFYDNETFHPGDYENFPKNRGWNWAHTPASTFGNYECDPPEVLLNNSLIYIASHSQSKNFEFSIFTGDIVDHDVAHCDANVTKFAELRSYGIMKYYLKGLPIYPTLGNHDTFPYGQLAPHRLNNVTLNESVYHWNDELIARSWTSNGWLNESLKAEMSSHYSAFSTTTQRGLKVISLNSNCYYQKNLYSFIDMENEPDLFGQWQFLIDELVESEKKGQRVWILAHIPAGDTDALPIQSNIFAKIVERFSPYTIANIFYGHTHKDQFKILYSNDSTPINMAWISQSITPLGPSNPSWRYYEVEDESFNIVNAYNYYTPLNETWVSGPEEPVWLFEYSPRDTYDPEGKWLKSAPLNATFWDEFVLKRLSNQSDVDFAQMYTNHVYRNNPYVPDCKNGSYISNECYEDNYCYNLGFKVDDYFACVA